MSDYITPNYETIGTEEKRKLQELYSSTLLHAFSYEDYLAALAVINRVIDRLEGHDDV